MAGLSHILAESDDGIVKALIFVVALIFWGISALSKAAKRGSAEQKERMRKVREAIEQSQQAARQGVPQQGQVQQQRQVPQQQPTPRRQPIPQQRARQPVQLAPEIQRRVPPPVVTRPPQQKKATRRPVPVMKKRGATNYNVLTTKKPPAPPPLPRPNVVPEVQLLPEMEATPEMSTSRKSSGVAATAIHQWLTPATLRQQFILTEVFQLPVALREGR